MVVARQNKNSSIALTDLKGNKLTSYSQILDEVMTFLHKLIGTTSDKVFG